MAKKMIFDALMSTEKGGLTVHLSLYSFIEDKVTIIYCPALDISGYGLDEEEARKSFETIFSETIDYMMKKNTFHDDLKAHGWHIRGKKSNDLKAPSFADLYKKNEDFKNIIDNKEYHKFDKNVVIPA